MKVEPLDAPFGAQITEIDLGEELDDEDTWAYEIAQVYAFRGDIDTAFSWLDRAFERRDQSMLWLAGDPLMDNLRNDQRYFELMRRVGREAL